MKMNAPWCIMNPNSQERRVEKTATEAQQRAKKAYRDKGKRMTIDFYPQEMDLVEWIAQQEPKQTYIKDLIRKDMEQNQGK